MRADLLAGLVGPCQVTLRQVQVGTMGLFYFLLFSLLFAFVFGGGVFELLYSAVLPFELTLMVVVLPPSRQVAGAGEFSTDFCGSITLRMNFSPDEDLIGFIVSFQALFSNAGIKPVNRVPESTRFPLS